MIVRYPLTDILEGREWGVPRHILDLQCTPYVIGSDSAYQIGDAFRCME